MQYDGAALVRNLFQSSKDHSLPAQLQTVAPNQYQTLMVMAVLQRRGTATTQRIQNSAIELMSGIHLDQDQM